MEIKELLRKGSLPLTSEKELQDILSLFHIENLEFRVKAELIDLLDKTDLNGNEPKEIKHLFEKIWDQVSERGKTEKEASPAKFTT